MVALVRGRAASPNRLPNGPSHRFSRLRRRDGRRENICAYILRRSEVSDLSVKKKYRRRPPVLPGSDFLSRSCDQGKAARSSPRHRISRPFLKLNFASANPLKFQCRNSCAKLLICAHRRKLTVPRLLRGLRNCYRNNVVASCIWMLQRSDQLAFGRLGR